MSHIWYIQLSLLSLMKEIFLNYFSSRCIFVSAFSPNSQKLYFYLENKKHLKLPKINTFSISYTSLNKNGVNIRARFEEFKAALTRSAVGKDAKAYKIPKELQPFQEEWLRILTQHFREQCTPLVNYLCTIENLYETHQVENKNLSNIVIHYSGIPLSKKTIPTCYKLLDINFPLLIKSHFSKVSFRENLSLLIWIAIAWPLRVIKNLKKIRIDFKAEVDPEAIKKGTILVQYEQNMLDRLPFVTSLDWFVDSNLDPNRVVILFDRFDTPVTDEILLKLKEFKFGYLDALAPESELKYIHGIDFNTWVSIISLVPVFGKMNDYWQWLFLAKNYLRLQHHRNIIKKTNAVSLYQHQEFAANSLLQNLACRMEDTLFIWSYWSFLGLFASWYSGVFADLFLAWGKYDLNHNCIQDFDFSYAAQVGILGYDGRDENDEIKAKEIREKFPSSVNFVLTLFDSSHAENGKGVHHDTANVIIFFKTVFDLLLANPNWGCIIKPKGTTELFLQQNSLLKQEFKRLSSEGRCILLNPIQRPSIAALAADAVACYSINSAGIQSFIHTGKPVVHFDPQNLKMFPSSDFIGNENIIFRTPTSFSSALKEIAIQPHLTNIGDHSAIQDEIDPFRDGYGRKRSSEIITDYLMYREAGHSMLEGLNLSLNNYGKKYGFELVSTRRHVNSDETKIGPWKTAKEKFYPAWPSPLPPTVNSQWAQKTARKNIEKNNEV
ncbi:MAG: hypothetical protein HWE34_05880 [Methylocystaceae bacterium]|nr:hypothetical protein [Methylocystaceae bacterium]